MVLSDIEMPRMDGFDLVRNIRGDARLRDLPVIMITSRIAQKHRDYAAELGVDHYLGKPYSEEDLLALIGATLPTHGLLRAQRTFDPQLDHVGTGRPPRRADGLSRSRRARRDAGGAFRDLLHPRSVAIYRVVGDGGNQRWLTRARLVEGDAVATADPVWVDLDSLPELKAHPARCEALTGQTVVTNDGRHRPERLPACHRPRRLAAVLELVTDGALHTEAQRMVCSILRIYRNFRAARLQRARHAHRLLNRKTFDESFSRSRRPSRRREAATMRGAPRAPAAATGSE
jgi:CheY-like chemotaxis protein